MRCELRLAITCCNEAGQETQRTLRPVALVFHAGTANLVAWCELWLAIRTFRPNRVSDALLLGGHFRGDGDHLRRRWARGWTRERDAPANSGAA